MLERQRVMNFRSKAMEGGNPKKPSPDSIDYGELAVGYHVLNERLFFKNDDDEIVEIPVQNIVKFRDWQKNEEDGSYYWTTEREFHNLDDIYDYIRLCQNKTDMYDQRKGTLGCAQCEDGNTYFFVSPKADYSSLLDPGRLTGNGEMVHSKKKYSPFGEKCIVRKHIPCGFLAENEETARCINPLPGATYAFSTCFFNGYYIDVRIPAGRDIIIETAGNQHLEIEMEIFSHSNERFNTETAAWEDKPYSLLKEPGTLRYVLANKADYDTSFMVRVAFDTSITQYGQKILRMRAVDASPVTQAIKKEGGEYPYEYVVNLGNLQPLYNDAEARVNCETTSPYLKIENDKIVCIKQSDFSRFILKDYVTPGSTGPLYKESDDTYIWKQYLANVHDIAAGHGKSYNTSANEAVYNFLFERRSPECVLERRHRSYLYSRKQRGENWDKVYFKVKLVDKDNIMLFTLRNGRLTQDTTISIGVYGRDGFRYLLEYTVPQGYYQRGDIIYVTPQDCKVMTFGNYISANGYVVAESEEIANFNPVRKVRKKFCKMNKSTDTYPKWFQNNDLVHFYNGNFTKKQGVVFRFFNRHRGVKSKYPMKVVMKTKGCGKYRTPEYDNI